MNILQVVQSFTEGRDDRGLMVALEKFRGGPDLSYHDARNLAETVDKVLNFQSHTVPFCYILYKLTTNSQFADREAARLHALASLLFHNGQFDGLIDDARAVLNVISRTFAHQTEDQEDLSLLLHRLYPDLFTKSAPFPVVPQHVDILYTMVARGNYKHARLYFSQLDLTSLHPASAITPID